MKYHSQSGRLNTTAPTRGSVDEFLSKFTAKDLCPTSGLTSTMLQQLTLKPRLSNASSIHWSPIRFPNVNHGRMTPQETWYSWPSSGAILTVMISSRNPRCLVTSIPMKPRVAMIWSYLLFAWFCHMFPQTQTHTHTHTHLSTTKKRGQTYLCQQECHDRILTDANNDRTVGPNSHRLPSGIGQQPLSVSGWWKLPWKNTSGTNQATEGILDVFLV